MTKYESFVWNSRPTWYSLNLRMSSVMCKLPCLLTYSVTLSCLITLAKCAPVTYCPNFDGTPQFYSDEDGKCHLCLSCEEGYGLSEECGAGLGQRARCIPCPSGKYSPNYDWNVCGFCRICDNTMEDKIPCTSRTDRQCGPCKLGYFRHDERYDFCVRCEDERNSHLYPDCLRTTPRVTSLHSTMAVTPANIINTSLYSVSTASTENTGLKPWTVVIVILCICVVIVVIVVISIGIYFLKDHLCPIWKKCFSKPNSSSQPDKNKTERNGENGSPAETEELIRIPNGEESSVPDPRQVTDTITHNGKCEDRRQGATLFCGPDDSDASCQAQGGGIDSCNPQTMTVEVQINHSPQADQDNTDETSGQSQSSDEEQLPALSINSTGCKETQTEDVDVDVDVAAPSDQLSSESSSDDKEPCEDNLSENEDQPCHPAGEQPNANTTPTQTQGTQTYSSELETDASRRHFLKRLDLACRATKGVHLGDMHTEDVKLLNNILYVKPEVEDTSREFNYMQMADEVFGIDKHVRKTFHNASDVIIHLANTDPSLPTVERFLGKLEQSNKCYIVLNKLVDQIIKRNNGTCS